MFLPNQGKIYKMEGEARRNGAKTVSNCLVAFERPTLPVIHQGFLDPLPACQYNIDMRLYLVPMRNTGLRFRQVHLYRHHRL